MPMMRRCTFAVLIAALAGGAGADVIAAPTTKPATTRPVRLKSKSPTTRAVPVATSRPASPQELGKILREMDEDEATLARIAYFDLSRGLTEKPAGFSFFADPTRSTHYGLLKRLREAANDKTITGVLVNVSGGGIELAQAFELRDALIRVGARGKQTMVYADRYSTATYVLATGAKDVCILQGGEIVMPGVALETMFFRGLFDKLGVEPDLIQIGDYKGAKESYMRSEASPELKGELNKLVDGLYAQLVAGIAKQRGISEMQVKALIDRAMIPAAGAKEARLVDHVVDIDGLRDLLAEKEGKKVTMVPNYGVEPAPEVEFSSPFGLLQMLSHKPKEVSGPAVALVYVTGMITEGESGDVFSDDGINEVSLRKAMRIARRDDDVKAVVIRIDSPGGSALASEAAWQAIQRVAKEKPVVISVGAMAASGGYYIASAGERIFADDCSIVGSIGVVGGKVALGGLYQKLGLSSETFSRGANAAMFSSSAPFTENQRLMLQQLMKQTYDQFVSRILETRKGRIADIEKVAQGRIFTANVAVSLGLVDQIGGLDAAIDYAAARAKLSQDAPVRVLPAPKSFAEMLNGDSQTLSPAPEFRSSSLPMELNLLPNDLRELAVFQLTAVRALERGTIMLVPPVMMKVR